MTKKMVYFYPSQTSQCVLVFERVSFKQSGFGIMGHVPLEVALDIHRNNKWSWMDQQDYDRYMKDEPDPSLYHVHSRSEWQKSLKFHACFRLAKEAEDCVKKLKGDQYSFVVDTEIKGPAS